QNQLLRPRRLALRRWPPAMRPPRSPRPPRRRLELPQRANNFSLGLRRDAACRVSFIFAAIFAARFCCRALRPPLASDRIAGLPLRVRFGKPPPHEDPRVSR